VDKRPEPPPEGRLLSEALERSGMSIRQASAKAGISYGRWRQIASGVQNASPGSWAKVVGPARTVARMAQVVGVTPEEMAEAGREDVAQAMREGTSRHLSAVPSDGSPVDEAMGAIRKVEGLTEDEVRAFEMLARGMAASRAGEEGNGSRRQA
jgi:hypothetical protein